VPEEIAGPVPTQDSYTYLPEIGTAVTYQSEPHRRDSRRTSKTARFAESESIVSHIPDAVSAPRTISPVPMKPVVRTTVTPTYALPTEFDESSLATPQQQAMLSAQQKKGKLTKTPAAKLAKNDVVVKKNRWSLRSSKATPVAV
jgi:hypothetical protein